MLRLVIDFDGSQLREDARNLAISLTLFTLAIGLWTGAAVLL